MSSQGLYSLVGESPTRGLRCRNALHIPNSSCQLVGGGWNEGRGSYAVCIYLKLWLPMLILLCFAFINLTATTTSTFDQHLIPGKPCALQEMGTETVDGKCQVHRGRRGLAFKIQNTSG